MRFRIFLLCACILFINNMEAQSYFSKRLKNLDSNISANVVGWGTDVAIINNKIFNLNSCIDSTGISGAYVSLLELNDTGKTTKTIIFYGDSSRFSISPQHDKIMINTLDGGLVFIMSYDSKYWINGKIKTKIVFVKCNALGDTIFSTSNNLHQLNSDSILKFPKYVLQLQDSSFVILGIVNQHTNDGDSNFIMRLDKTGNLLWDTLFFAGSNYNLPTGLWVQNNIIKVSVMSEGYYDHKAEFSRNTIFEFDTSGHLVKQQPLVQKSMAGGKTYNKYNEEYTTFFGVADTLTSYKVIMNTGNVFNGTELTTTLGLLDNQYRLKWRYIIPMDTVYRGLGKPSYRWILASGNIRLKDGNIIWYGTRTCRNGSNNKYIAGMWLLKTDSVGNRLWDRVYTDKESPNILNDLIYTSGLCEADNGDIIFTGSNFSNQQLAITMRVDSNGMFSPTDSGFVGNDEYGIYPYISYLQTFTYPNAIIEVGPIGKYELKVFPNPAATNLYVMFNVHEAGFLNILDMQGKIVYQQAITTMQNQTAINVSQLPKGMYIIECLTAKNKMIQKWIKE
jgi:Secretion system C-terminal sorting domain